MLTDTTLSAEMANVLQYFGYEHYSNPKVKSVCGDIFQLATHLSHQADNPEMVVALRKLLECKDACIRALLTSSIPMPKSLNEQLRCPRRSPHSGQQCQLEKGHDGLCLIAGQK